MRSYRLSSSLPLRARLGLVRLIVVIILPGKHTTRTSASTSTDHILAPLDAHPGIYVDLNGGPSSI